MKENVLDVLTYMFESHLYDDNDANINRESLQAELVEIGFDHTEVEKAFDWLADLPSSSDEITIAAPNTRSTRIFNTAELKKLDEHCRGYLLDLEQIGVLNPASRELVIDRVIALETDEISIEQLRWVCLIVLYNLSESELSYTWLEDMVMELNSTQLH
jgi:Smg protein